MQLRPPARVGRLRGFDLLPLRKPRVQRDSPSAQDGHELVGLANGRAKLVDEKHNHSMYVAGLRAEVSIHSQPSSHATEATMTACPIPADLECERRNRRSAATR